MNSTETHFWGSDPNILLQFPQQLFPTAGMTFAATLNSITRLLILVLACLLFIYPGKRDRILLASVASIGFIYVYYYAVQEKETFMDKTYPSEAMLEEVFDPPSENAPMGNIRPGDYYLPEPKKPAAPANIPAVREQILDQFKKLWAKTIPESALARIFASPQGMRIFEESVRPFYTMASTTIPNNLKEFFDRTYPQSNIRRNGNVRGNDSYNMEKAANFTVGGGV